MRINHSLLLIFTFVVLLISFFLRPPQANAATFSIGGRVTVPGCIGNPACIGGFGNILITASGPSSSQTTTNALNGGGYSMGGLKAGSYIVRATPTACLTGGGSAGVKIGPNNGSASFTMSPRLTSITVNVNESITGAGISGVPADINGLSIGSTGGGGTLTSPHSCSLGTETANITVPIGYKAVSATSQTFTGSDSNAVVNFTLLQLKLISGNVYDDTNENKIKDGSEKGYPGITVTVTNNLGTQTTISDANGDYSFYVEPTSGNSTVAISNIPADWFNTSPATQTVPSNVDTPGLNFGIAPYNTISGNVILDLNKNGIKDPGETNYIATPAISATSGVITNNPDGSFLIKDLLPGTYNVSYNSLPVGYYMTWPINGPPPIFQVTVGPNTCSVNGAPGATCAAGNISDMSFGITDNYPWFQSTCGDIRLDNGITNLMPLAAYIIVTDPTCSSPGIPFPGDSDPTYGKGQNSPSHQQVGGAAYPEVFTSSSPLNTSYTSLLAKSQNAGINPTDLSTVCVLLNCSLPNNLQHGIYIANGDVNLNPANFQNNNNYVFLINGNLTIRGDIAIPNTPNASTALFSTTKNIIVAGAVGSPANNTNTDLNGWFIAGQNFIVNSQGTCTDLRLNVGGTVVANAMGTGGSFQNNRDLCADDVTDPTVSFTQRLDLILNAPQFLMQQQTISQELAP